jgi:ATP-dependent helicase/nuclease subunit A
MIYDKDQLTRRIKRLYMFHDLTLQQFCALDYNRNMVVTAGPGAGKTGILSRRFCFILLTDRTVQLPQILTLTFTEKAAEEMKGRIYRMISKIERELGSDHDRQILQKVREARERFNRNRISTIHSFCAELLRDNPVEANLDPGFSIIQGAKQKEILEESIESAIGTVWKSNRELLSPLLRAFGTRKGLISAIKNIINHPMTYEHAFETGARLFETRGWTSQVFGDYCCHIRDNYILPYYRGLKESDKSKERYDDLISLFDDWDAASEKDHQFSGIPDLFAALRRYSRETESSCTPPAAGAGLKKIMLDGLMADFFPDLIRDNSPDAEFEHEFRLFMDAAGICLEQYHREKRRINSLDFADLEKECHSFLTKLSEKDPGRLTSIQKNYKYIMVDEFQDTNIVQWDIIHMLCTVKGQAGHDALMPGKLFVVGDKRQAIYRFRGGDVTVFEAVTEKIRESNSGKPTGFFWQEGDLDEILTPVDKDYPGLKRMHADSFGRLPDKERDKMLSGDIYLPHNFRTGTRPIEFFNSTFKEIFGRRDGRELERYETAHREISMPESRRPPSGNSGTASIYLTALAKKDSAAKEAALVADILEGVLGRKGAENREYNVYGDIREKINAGHKAVGILLFRFTHIKTFEAVFREAGIPFMIHRGKGFYRCQEVMEIVQLLNYLSDDRQLISLLSSLRSPLFGLADHEVFDLFYEKDISTDKLFASDSEYIRQISSQLTSWRFLSNRFTIAELIRTIIADRGLTAIHSAHPNGDQRRANVEKLIETARKFQVDGNGALSDFVSYCLRMADEEEEEGEAPVITGEGCPITIMTIHAAKGLEFPMVIIPDLDYLPQVRTNPGVALRLYPSDDGNPGRWNSQQGIMPVWQVEIPGLGYLKKYSPLGYLLKRRDWLEDIAENRRVFYVACTRAMNHLVLAGSIKKSLMEKCAEILSPEDYRERASILDILNDVYRFDPKSPSGREGHCMEDGDVLQVLWREPADRAFHGIEYSDAIFSPDKFYAYSDAVAKLNLTNSIVTHPYFQISYKTLSIYKECPRKFYLDVILGIRPADNDVIQSTEETESAEAKQVKDNDEPEFSGDALLLGLLVHGYLERHSFGEGFDETLFESLWKKSVAKQRGIADCEDSGSISLRHKAREQIERTITDERLIRALSGTQDYSEASFLVNAAPGLDFRGVIDRVFKDKNKDCWSIIDWKSNELKGRDPEKIASDNNYNLQLACYKYAFERLTGERVEDLFIYFTDAGFLLKSDLQINAEDIILELSGKIAGYSSLKPLKEDLRCNNVEKCRFCGYHEFCEKQ